MNEPGDSAWLLAEWYRDIKRCAELSEIPDADTAAATEALWRSATLRRLAMGDADERHRAWLCFLAVVDVFLDPVGRGLPLVEFHPHRVRVPSLLSLFDPFWESPEKIGFIRGTSEIGKAQTAAFARLRTEYDRLRTMAHEITEALQAEERARVDAFGGQMKTLDAAEYAALRRALQSWEIRRQEAAALASAALAIRESAQKIPHVYSPDAGTLVTPPGALICGLSFTLRTDETLPRPTRNRLIAEVVSDFFPAEYSPDEPLSHRTERVRLHVKDAERRAAKSLEQVAWKRQGEKPIEAFLGFAASELARRASVPDEAPTRAERIKDVLENPNARGVRYLTVVGGRPGAIEEE